MEFAALRAIHLLGGLVWAGFAIFLGAYLLPAFKEAGPGAAGPVMAAVMKRRFVLVMNLAGFASVLSGIRLYMLVFSSAWLTTPGGLCLTAGAVLGLGGMVIGSVVSRPTSVKIAALQAAIAAQGGKPTPEQVAEMPKLSAKMGRAGTLVAWHLGGAAALMAFSKVL